MANPTFTSLVPTVWDNNAAIYTWSSLPNAAPGPSISGPGWTDRSVQVTGTFGAGGSCQLQGSNDGVNWFTLHDPFSNLLSFTSGALAEVTEIALFMRPNVTGGDGTTSINVVLVCCNHSRN